MYTLFFRSVINIDKFVNMKGLAEYLSVSRMTLYNMLKAGQLPQGKRFGKSARRWNLDDVKEFLNK